MSSHVLAIDECNSAVRAYLFDHDGREIAASLRGAYLAGFASGFWRDLKEVGRTWRRDRVFEPRSSADERSERYARWKSIVTLPRRQP